MWIKVEVQGSELVLDLSPVAEIVTSAEHWLMGEQPPHHEMRFPLSAIKGVTIEPRAEGEVEGTLAPAGRGLLGALHRGGESVMYVVAPAAKDVIVVHLHQQEYSMLVLGVRDPEDVAKVIKEAIA